MAGESVEIRIVAHDGTSQVFRAIQQSADRLGKDLTDAGRDGDRAFDRIEKGAKDADRALDQAERRARTFGDRMQTAARGVDEFGAGLMVLGAGLTYAGNKAMEQERQVIALRAAYGDAADDMLRFAEELDNVTIFDDEDIRAGERFFASLYNNYNLSIQQIQDLMATTADLASASGISFEDASNRVTAAIRGEGEAAEWLGLTMNQQSIDRENLTLSMTNQEAAQFRLNALNQQAAVYQGTAAEVAASSVGTYAELRDTVNDAAGALGAFIGPMGSMMTGLGTMALGLSGTIGLFGKFVTAARGASAAMASMAAAGSAMTAALGAGAFIGAGIGGFMGEFVNSLRDGEGVTKAFSDSTNLLAAAMGKLQDGDPVGFFRTLLFGIEEADGALKSFTTTATTLLDEAARQQVLGNTEVAEAIRQLVGETDNAIHASEQYLASQQFLADAQLEANKRGISLASAQDILTKSYTQSDAELRVYTEAVNALAVAMLDPANNAEDINLKLDALKTQFNTGQLTLDQYRESLVSLAREYGTLPGDIQSTAAATQDAAGGFNLMADALDRASEARAEYLRIQKESAEHDKAEAEYNEANAQHDQERFDEERRMAEERRREQEEEHNRRVAYQQQEEEYEQAAHEAMLSRWDEEATARRERRTAEEEDDRARYQRAADLIASLRSMGGMDTPLASINMSSVATGASEFAGNVATANAALENTYRIIVGNTEAMKGQADATLKWAEGLINVRGEAGRIDELLADGLIDEGTYNRAQDAYDSIALSVQTIGDNLDAVQARQAPLIAELTSQQAAYTEQLRGMSAEQQLVALGWMDSATSAQAYNLVMQAGAVANGEFGASGRAAFEAMAEGALQANPVLEKMLVDAGLLSVQMDALGNKTYSWNFEGLEEGKSDIDRLTESIDALIVVMGGVPPLHLDADTQGAVDAIADVESRLGALDGQTATTHQEGENSGALGAIDAAGQALLGLDGQTATTYQEGIPDDALGAISNVSQQLAGLDGRTATVTVNAIDNAGGVLGGVLNQLLSIDGRSATATVTTYYNSVGVGLQMATGGTVWADTPRPSPWGVPQAANGRTVLVGEAGPELVNLPHGAQVTPHAASMSRLDAMPPVPAATTIHMPIYGNVYGVDDLADALAGALDQRRRGYGSVVTT